MFCRWRRTLEKPDIYLCTAGKAYGCNSCAVTMVMYWNEFFQGMVLSTRQTSYPLQTYIQQMVVTLDYSTMNVDQIAQAMKLNNLSLDSAKNIYSYDTSTDRLPVPAKIFCRGYYTGIS